MLFGWLFVLAHVFNTKYHGGGGGGGSHNPVCIPALGGSARQTGGICRERRHAHTGEVAAQDLLTLAAAERWSRRLRYRSHIFLSLLIIKPKQNNAGWSVGVNEYK